MTAKSKVERDPNILLTNYISERALACGVPWDTYHADFLLGNILHWLDEHDAILTGTGVTKRP